MITPEHSAIARVVEHLKGPVALARALQEKTRIPGRPSHQQVSKWVHRGYVSPLYLGMLEPMLPEGVTRAQLENEVLAGRGLPPVEERRHQGDRRKAARRVEA